MEWLARHFPLEVGGEAEDTGGIGGAFLRNDAVPVLVLVLIAEPDHAAAAGHVALT